MAKDYEIDRQGLQQIATGPKMQDAMTRLAYAAKAGAEAIAPVKTGRYSESFVVENARIKAGFDQQPRAAARLSNTAPYADVVEGRHHVLATVKAIIESGGF